MKTFFAKYYLLVGAVVIVIVAGGVVWYVSSSKAPSFGTVTVARGNVIASINEPATVNAETSANLSFEEGGQIAQVNVTEGQSVSAGETLVQLDTSSLQAAVEEAQASVAAAQAQLAQLASGTRPQQLAIDQSAVTSAQTSLSVADQGAFTAADDAVTNQTDAMFSTPNGNNPIFLVPISDSQLVNNIQSTRASIGVTISAWYAAVSSATSTQTSLNAITDASLPQIASVS